MNKSGPRVLSLFSGCGGLDLGFAIEGFNITEAYDHWKPAVENHSKNSRLIGGQAFQRSLALHDNQIQLEALPFVDVVLGGPPCQGFSFAGKQRVDDPRNMLYVDFKRIVAYIKPRVFLMENVRGLEKMALADIEQSFKIIGYNVSINRVRAVDLGIPQKRERLIIVGTREGERPFQTPEVILGSLFGAPARRCILDVIGDLPPPKPAIGQIDSSNYLDDHAYQPFSATEQKFISHIPNGGYFADAPRETLPLRLQKIFDDPLKYRSPRLFPKPDPLGPSQTIPASSSPSIGGVIAPDLFYGTGCAAGVLPKDFVTDGVYTSPTPSRRFTPREIARLQGFPDDFLFSGSASTKTKMIGNAVPVPVGQLFAREILRQLFAKSSSKAA